MSPRELNSFQLLQKDAPAHPHASEENLEGFFAITVSAPAILLLRQSGYVETNFCGCQFWIPDSSRAAKRQTCTLRNVRASTLAAFLVRTDRVGDFFEMPLNHLFMACINVETFNSESAVACSESTVAYADSEFAGQIAIIERLAAIQILGPNRIDLATQNELCVAVRRLAARVFAEFSLEKENIDLLTLKLCKSIATDILGGRSGVSFGPTWVTWIRR